MMPLVSFIVVLVCSLIAAILAIVGLKRLYNKSPKARATYATGFGIWLMGIVLAAILFGFLTV
jgi:hypothetical protein